MTAPGIREPAPGATAVELRVLSYNVRGCRDDTATLARLVRDLDPDVMCVQEAPKYLQWRTRCAALARACGLLYVTGGGSTGGTALLASLRVDVEDAVEVCLARQWGWPARGVAAATVRKGGAALRVASLHLPLDPEQRLAHARRAAALAWGAGLAPAPAKRVDGVGAPAAVHGGTAHALAAGDLNERPGRPAWAALAASGLRDAGPGGGPTYPAGAPAKRIDGVVASAGVEVLDYRVVDAAGVERASDHRPVLVTVRVPTG